MAYQTSEGPGLMCVCCLLLSVLIRETSQLRLESVCSGGGGPLCGLESLAGLPLVHVHVCVAAGPPGDPAGKL